MTILCAASRQEDMRTTGLSVPSFSQTKVGMMGGAEAHYDGIVAFSQTDFTDDLKRITVPVLVMHGDDDQIVPYADSAPLSAKLLKNGTLKTYKGFPHGMPTTQAETINADLLAFIKGSSVSM